MSEPSQTSQQMQDALNALKAMEADKISKPVLQGLPEQEKEPQTPTVPLPAVAVASDVFSKSPTKITYYSRMVGTRYCFRDGGVAVFQDSTFQFDPVHIPADYMAPPTMTREAGWKQRHEELEYVCTVPNPVFSKVPVPVMKSDAVVLREVGHAGGGTATSGVGLVGSFAAQNLLAHSAG